MMVSDDYFILRFEEGKKILFFLMDGDLVAQQIKRRFKNLLSKMLPHFSVESVLKN